MDKELKNEYDFNTPVTKSIILYAKRVLNGNRNPQDSQQLSNSAKIIEFDLN